MLLYASFGVVGIENGTGIQLISFSGFLEANVDIFSFRFAGFSCETLRKNCLLSTDKDDGLGLMAFSGTTIEW